MLHIPALLSKAEVARVRQIIDAGDWVDGTVTAGPQSALAKNNEQLAEGSSAAREAGAIVLGALERSPLFIAGALPLKVFPPLFNRYGPGHAFGTHVDNAVRILRGTDFRVRSDLSATLFLADPEEYDGGELVIEGEGGAAAVKHAAGDIVVYTATTLHRVTPVTRGARVASFFWLQSMVRDDGERRLLLQLDRAVQALVVEKGNDDPTVIQLTGLYHNLLRRWADA